MTKTDELRHLLDKYGVKYETNFLDFNDDHYNIYTKWNDIVYVEYEDGTVLRVFDCTPEQAIAATVNNETCTMTQLDRWDGMDPHYLCNSCGHENYESYLPNYCPNCGRKVKQ